MEWRSQGLSDDTPGTLFQTVSGQEGGSRVCYVPDFESTYVQDMEQFITDIVAKNNNKELVVLAHSMGGLIASRLAQLNPNLISKIILTAPMLQHKNVLDLFGLVDVELPLYVANKFASLMDFMGQSKQKADGRDTCPSKGITELLSHNTYKIEKWNLLRSANPNIVLAGASFGWAKAALDLEQIVLREAYKIKTPIMIFMAEDDAFVYNSAILQFAASINNSSFHGKIATVVGPIPNTFHEILMETDEIVEPIMQLILSFSTASNIISDKNASISPKSQKLKFIQDIQKIPCFSDLELQQMKRWPKGHHSGTIPPSLPTFLVFKHNPKLRRALSLTLKGGIVAGCIYQIQKMIISDS